MPVSVQYRRAAKACLVISALAAATIAATQAEFFVAPAPAGNDANAGTFANPFATLQKARDKVRTINANMTGDIIVNVRGGTYYFDDQDGDRVGLLLDQHDGGTNGHMIYYRGYRNEYPALVGGKLVTAGMDLGGKVYQVYNDTGVISKGVNVQCGWWFCDVLIDSGNGYRTDAPVGSIAPTVRRLIDFRGSDMQHPVKNISVENMVLRCTAFDQKYLAPMLQAPATGTTDTTRAKHADCELDHLRNGLLTFENAERCSVRFCRINSAGLHGVIISKWAQYITVYGNLIEKIGGNGVYLTGYNFGEGSFSTPEAAYVNKYNTVVNNIIQTTGKYITHAAGVIAFQSGDNLIANNVFLKMKRYGISIKGQRTDEWLEQEKKETGSTMCYGVNVQSLMPLTNESVMEWKRSLLFTRNTIIRSNEIGSGGAMTEAAPFESWRAGLNNVLDNNNIAAVFYDDHGWKWTITRNRVPDEQGIGSKLAYCTVTDNLTPKIRLYVSVGSGTGMTDTCCNTILRNRWCDLPSLCADSMGIALDSIGLLEDFPFPINPGPGIYEAESFENWYGGSAGPYPEANKSGGFKVRFIGERGQWGEDGTVLFRRIQAPSDGTYKLQFFHDVADQGATGYIRVNGVAEQTIVFPKTVASTEVSISLKKGRNNKVFLYNDRGGPVPAIDKIVVSSALTAVLAPPHRASPFPRISFHAQGLTVRTFGPARLGLYDMRGARLAGMEMEEQGTYTLKTGSLSCRAAVLVMESDGVKEVKKIFQGN